MADDEQFELSGELEDSILSDSDIGDSASFVIDSSNSDLDPVSDVVEDAAEEIVQSVPEENVSQQNVAAPVLSKSQALLQEFGLFEAILATSLLLITAASIMMLFSLGDYGGLTNAWRTTDITVK